MSLNVKSENTSAIQKKKKEVAWFVIISVPPTRVGYRTIAKSIALCEPSEYAFGCHHFFYKGS